MRASLLLLVLAVPLAAQADDPAGLPNELGREYGFLGLHVSRFNDGLSGLVAGDLDGDGVADLAVINNARGRIELLLRRREGEPAMAGSAADPERVNELADEGYFRRESYAVEEKVGSLALQDMDGDGRAELVLCGDSGRLTLAWPGLRGDEPRSRRVRLPGDTGGALVRAGDVDGDGRPDVVVCARQAAWVLLQAADGSLAEPLVLPHATSEPDGFELLDLDGDRVPDLLFSRTESEWPLRWRLGRGGGRFGEERSLRLAPLRAWVAGDADRDGRAEVAAVRRQSGRVTLLRFGADGAVAGEDGRVALGVVPLDDIKDEDARGFLLDDLDGDGVTDLIVAEPSAARLAIYRGASGTPHVHPSLLGASHPRRMATPEGPCLVVAAPAEGALGISPLGAGGEPAFPRALPLPPVPGAEGSPELLALDVGPEAAGGADAIWVVVGAGKGRARQHALVRLAAQGAELGRTPLKDLKTDPRDLLLADLDRDGRTDALLCLPTELPRLLLAGADGFREVDVAQQPGLGLLKGLAREALDWADVDGDGARELLVPGPSFVRAIHLDAQGRPQVVLQLNLPDPGAQAACVAAADVDGDGRPEVLLAERSQKLLYALRAGPGGDTQVLWKADLPDFLPRGLRAGGRAAPLLLLAPDRVGRLAAAGGDATFLPDLEFEVPVKDAFVNDLCLGDVNGDDRTDLVLTETRRHQVVVARTGPSSIDFALRFPVYDERLFEQGRGGQEPRELALADVTGDGLADLALLVHDRLILYPQEPAP